MFESIFCVSGLVPNTNEYSLERDDSKVDLRQYQESNTNQIWDGTSQPANGCLQQVSQANTHSHHMAMAVANKLYNALPRLLRPTSNTACLTSRASRSDDVASSESKLGYPPTSINSLITSLSSRDNSSLRNGLLSSVSAATPVTAKRPRSNSPVEVVKEERSENSPEVLPEENRWSPSDCSQQKIESVSESMEYENAYRKRRPSSPCMGSMFRPPQPHLASMGIETLLRPRFPPNAAVQNMVNPLSSFLGRPASPHDAFPPHNLAQLVSSGAGSTPWSRPHPIPILGALSNHQVHAISHDKNGPVAGKNSGVMCSNCGTNNTKLWRRNPKGDIVCNACGLYFKLHNVDRPSHLFRDSPMTRRRNPRATHRKRPFEQGGALVEEGNSSHLSPSSSGLGNSSRDCVLSPRSMSSPGPQSDDVLSAAYALSSIASQRTQRDSQTTHLESASSNRGSPSQLDSVFQGSPPLTLATTHETAVSNHDRIILPSSSQQDVTNHSDGNDIQKASKDSDNDSKSGEDLCNESPDKNVGPMEYKESDQNSLPRPPPPALLRLPTPSLEGEDSTVLVSPTLGSSVKA